MKENGYKIIVFLILLFIVAWCTSCTTNAYRSLYYQPYKYHSPEWYQHHKIYWFYTPASKTNEFQPIKHYNRRYLYG